MQIIKLKKFINNIIAGLSYRSGFILNKPSSVILNLTNQCNLHCQHCDIWKEKNKYELSTNQWYKIIDDINAWLPGAEITLNGGEIFLRSDILDVIQKLKEKGANVILNTNGILVDGALAKTLIKKDINTIEVSLYSLKPEVHDELRGVLEAQAKAQRAVEHLVKFKKELGKMTRIIIACLVNEKNYLELPSIIEWASNKDIWVSLQPLDYNISRLGVMTGGGMWHKDYPLWPKNFEAFRSVWQKVIEMKKNGYKIINMHEQLQLMEGYYENPFSLQDSACYAGQKLFIVGPDGEVFLCFRRGRVGSILKNSAKEIWKSEEAKTRRAEFKNCLLTCRVMTCNFRPSVIKRILRK